MDDPRQVTAVEALSDRLALHVTRGFHWRDCDDYTKAGLRSDFSRLVLVESCPRSGGGWIEDDRQRADLTAGHGYLVPGGTSLSLAYRRGIVLYSTFLRLHGPLGSDLLHGLPGLRQTRLTATERADLGRLVESRRTLGQALVLRALLLAVLGRMVDLDLADLNRRHRLAERWSDLLREIDRIPPARASVTLLARRLGEGAEALAKRFRRDTGTSLKAFLMDRLRQRLLEALAGEATIAAIAEDLGFSDAFYCSRCCRRLLGEAPSTYRQRLRER